MFRHDYEVFVGFSSGNFDALSQLLDHLFFNCGYDLDDLPRLLDAAHCLLSMCERVAIFVSTDPIYADRVRAYQRKNTQWTFLRGKLGRPSETNIRYFENRCMHECIAISLH
jgi:hypothetical protein